MSFKSYSFEGGRRALNKLQFHIQENQKEVTVKVPGFPILITGCRFVGAGPGETRATLLYERTRDKFEHLLPGTLFVGCDENGQVRRTLLPTFSESKTILAAHTLLRIEVLESVGQFTVEIDFVPTFSPQSSMVN